MGASQLDGTGVHIIRQVSSGVHMRDFARLCVYVRLCVRYVQGCIIWICVYKRVSVRLCSGEFVII